MKLRIRPEARAEILEAARWYEDRQLGLGERFVQEMEAAFARIEAGPLRFRVAYRTLRRALARRFPYAVYFVAAPTEAIVVAVLHQRRDLDVLEKRMMDVQ